jgi:hypothetical protein
MAQKEKIHFFDERQALQEKQAIEKFVKHLNKWLGVATEEGLNVHHERLFNFMERPQAIKDELLKIAKQDAKSFKLKSARQQIINSAEEAAQSLISGLQKCFNLRYLEDSAGGSFNHRLIHDLKSYIDVSEGKVTLIDGWQTIVDAKYTHEPDELGLKLFDSLRKALAAIQRHNDQCVANGLQEYRIELQKNAAGGFIHPLVNQNFEPYTKEFCERNFEKQSEQKLEMMRRAKNDDSFKRRQREVEALPKQKPKDTRFSETLTTGEGRDIAT